MKSLVLRLLPALALVGCGSLPATDQSGGIDSGKVAAVNYAASRSGVQVVWINMPQKKSAPGS